jgi:hypothetical protein
MTRRDSHEELLSAEVEAELISALKAAWAPSELDPAVSELLITQALEDPLAPATDEEIAESERLRQALDGELPHPDADLARAVRLAAEPGDLSELSGARAEKAAMGGAPASSRGRRGAVIPLVFGAAAATLAVAASVALFLRVAPQGEDVAQSARSLAVSRSTAPLFDEKFEPGQTSARIDRIALARARDLRSNRYAMWGVR